MTTRGRAVVIRGAGDVDVLSVEGFELRDPGRGEALVQVAAAGLNRADCLQRRGLYPPSDESDVPTVDGMNIAGIEFAGTVESVGPGCHLFRAGDRVMGICAGGGMATHVVAHERTLVPVPQGMSLEHAAAVPEVFVTAYDAMFVQAGLGMGESVLIHAVASGVGTAAIQLARVAGATSIGTSRTAAKLERCTALGLDRGIVVEGGKLPDDVRVDLVLDMVGGAYLAASVRALRPRGRMIVVGLLAGAQAPLSLGTLLANRLSITGTVLRSRSFEDKAALAREFAARVVPLFESGVLAPVIDDVLPMADIREAHRRMEKNETFGKLVLAW